MRALLFLVVLSAGCLPAGSDAGSDAAVTTDAGCDCPELCVHWDPLGKVTCEAMPAACTIEATCGCAGALCGTLPCDTAAGTDLHCFYGTTTP